MMPEGNLGMRDVCTCTQNFTCPLCKRLGVRPRRPTSIPDDAPAVKHDGDKPRTEWETEGASAQDER